MELAPKTGMTIHLSCPKFAINSTKFWWEQVEMPGCPGAEASDSISYLDLFCQTHPQVANVRKKPRAISCHLTGSHAGVVALMIY